VAQRHGVSIVADASRAGLDDFLVVYGATFQRHELSPHSPRYFRSLLKRMLKHDCGTLLFAEHQGRRLAGALVLYFGDTASYKYGGSLPEQRHVMAPYLLHFEAMRLAKARGLRWYDFCGIARGDDPADDWSGFTAFKRKFGGVERNFVPALDFVYDAAAYEDYRRPTSVEA
jgi:lipid II:glycine glycyltransferase (peptidoglycan interpeptide bridge formation enzyme)